MGRCEDSHSPSRSPKRPIQHIDIESHDEPPSKRRSPSPAQKCPTPPHMMIDAGNTGCEKRLSRFPNGQGRRIDERSLSPKKHMPSGHHDLHTADNSPSFTSPQAPSDEESKIITALANEAEFPDHEDEEEKAFAPLRERIRKRKEATKASMEARQQERERAVQVSVRLKEDKTSKKKRLATIRRQQEKAVQEAELRQAKEAYDNFLKGFEAVRLGDEERDAVGAVQRKGRKALTTQQRAAARARALREGRIEEDEEDDDEGEEELEKIPFINVSSQWSDKVTQALGVRSEAAVLAKSVEGVDLSRKDIGRLLPPGQLIPGDEPWLNDEVINAWYANLCARLNEKDGYIKGPTSTPRWVAYSTAWYKNASEKGAASIANWSRRKGIKNEKLLKTERIFFPTNSSAHWTLLTISGKHRTIEYLDSLNKFGWKSKKYISLGLDWLKMELGKKFDPNEWTVLQTRSALQDNANDCGVFACLNGLALVKGVEDPSMEFGASDIPLGRRMFVATLLNGGFTGDFDL